MGQGLSTAAITDFGSCHLGSTSGKLHIVKETTKLSTFRTFEKSRKTFQKKTVSWCIPLFKFTRTVPFLFIIYFIITFLKYLYLGINKILDLPTASSLLEDVPLGGNPPHPPWYLPHILLHTHPLLPHHILHTS